MNQTIIKVILPNSVNETVEGFREKICRAIGDNDYGKLISNHLQTSTYPYCRFIGRTNKWVGFVSDKNESDATNLLMYLPNVMKEIDAKADLKLSVENRVKSISITDKPMIYRFSKCVLKNRSKNTKGLTGQQVVERHFWRLIRQAHEDGLLSIFPDERDIQIKVFDTRESVVKTNKNGNEYSQMWSGEFAVNVDLKGYWQMGQLLNRGFGMLFKDMRGTK